jgi:hypothetical protein
MSADHYVSQFHVREFQDPESLSNPRSMGVAWGSGDRSR